MFARFLLVMLLAALAWAVLVRPSGGAARERPYVVRPGDTLWSIASAHYRDDPREGVWRLQRRNGLGSALLRPGQRLVVP